MLLSTATLVILWQGAGSHGQHVPDHVQYWGRVARRGQLKVGDVAPDFQLPILDGEERVRLSSLRGGKPVVLVFGSYTCPSFRSHMQTINSLQAAYGDDTTFVHVYVREAHPRDSGMIPENSVLPPIFAATTLEERKKAATTCAASLDIAMQILVDDMDNHVAEKYRAWPECAYIIDEAGKIAFTSVGSGIDSEALGASLKTLVR